MNPDLRAFVERLRAHYADDLGLPACVPEARWQLLACDVLERALLLDGSAPHCLEAVAVARAFVRGEKGRAEIERIRVALTERIPFDGRGEPEDVTRVEWAAHQLADDVGYPEVFLHAERIAAQRALWHAREAVMDAGCEERITAARPAALIAWEAARAWPPEGALPSRLCDAGADAARLQVIGERPAEVVYFMKSLEARLTDAEHAWQAAFVASRLSDID